MNYLLQGQYRAAASQAKVATIPDSDSCLATSQATSQATSLATSRVSSQAGGPPYLARPGPAAGQRAPLATSSPSGIPTYQPAR